MRATLLATLSLAIPASLVPSLGCRASGQPSADPASVPHEAPNTLTEEERAAGFRLLFDGESLAGWRGFRREHAPGGWVVENGTIHFTAGGEGGDLISAETYADFELELEWRISEGGNSGIMFRVSEEEQRTWESGAEMQVLDNAAHRDGQNPKTSAGANYGLHAPAVDATRPPGEWNTVRILARGPHVEYWLNGVKVVEYEAGSPEWEALVAETKFAEMPGYGRAPSGHIALQDHGDPVWYRSLKIRRLEAPRG